MPRHPAFNAIAAMALGVLTLAVPALTAMPSAAAAAQDRKAEPQAAAPLPTEGLEAVDHASLDLVRVRPGVDLTRYRQVLIAPVELAVVRARDELEFRDNDARHAREYFAERLKAAFGDRAQATQPGPGVLMLAVTVTEFVPNSPAFARRQDGLGGFIQESIGVGRAAFQAVLTDSQTGQVVAVVADADTGLPFGQNLNLRTQYGDADQFIGRWARAMARLVEGKSAAG